LPHPGQVYTSFYPSLSRPPRDKGINLPSFPPSPDPALGGTHWDDDDIHQYHTTQLKHDIPNINLIV
jgi:hypothetical protein